MRRDISLFSGTFEMTKRVWKLVVVALVVAGATCENELDFKLQLLYDAVDSALDKPLVNRLVLSVLRIAAVGPKNKKIMNTCYANGNTDINTMRVCFTDATGISVNGVCNKEGIAKYMDKRFRHMNNFIWEFAVDLMGCSCFKKMEELVQCITSAALKVGLQSLVNLVVGGSIAERLHLKSEKNGLPYSGITMENIALTSHNLTLTRRNKLVLEA